MDAPEVLADVEEKLRRRGVSSLSSFSCSTFLPPIAESGSIGFCGGGAGVGLSVSSGASACGNTAFSDASTGLSAISCAPSAVGAVKEMTRVLC